MLERIKGKIFTDVNKNTLVLLYGTVLSQALPLIFSPVLARLYSPVEFGAFSLFLGIVAIAGNMSAGKMDFALYTAGSRENAVITAMSGMMFTLIFSAFILAVCLLYLGLSNLERLPVGAIVCIPLTVLFLGSSNVLVALTNREKRFKHISRAKVLLGVIWVVVNIVFGLLGSGAFGLILGYCVGQLASSLYLFVINKEDLLSVHFNKEIFKFNVLRNKNYAFIFLPAHLLNTISASGPAFFLTYFFGLGENGFFFKAARVGEAPTSVIRSSLGNVFWQKASHEYVSKGDARSTMIQFLLKLCAVGLPGYFFFYIYAEEMFVVLFGAPWAEAAVYFKILVPYFFVQFVVTPITIMIVLANKPWIDITWQIFYALTIVVSFGYGWLQDDVLVGLQLYTILMSLMQLISLGINYHYSIRR